jgi:hypothetical protein
MEGNLSIKSVIFGCIEGSCSRESVTCVYFLFFSVLCFLSCRSFLEAGDASTYVEPSPSDEGSVSQSPHKVGRKVRITRTAESIDFGTKLSEELPSCEPVSPNNNDLRADFDDYIFHASSVQKELHIPKSDIKGKEALDHSNNR